MMKKILTENKVAFGEAIKDAYYEVLLDAADGVYSEYTVYMSEEGVTRFLLHGAWEPFEWNGMTFEPVAETDWDVPYEVYEPDINCNALWDAAGDFEPLFYTVYDEIEEDPDERGRQIRELIEDIIEQKLFYKKIEQLFLEAIEYYEKEEKI